MKKNCIILVSLILLNTNIFADVLDNIAEYVVDKNWQNASDFKNQDIVNIIDTQIQADDLALDMLKNDVIEAWTTVGHATTAGLTQRGSTPIFIFIGDSKGDIVKFLLILEAIQLGIRLFPAAIATGIALPYTGYKGLVGAKIKAEKEYHDLLKSGFEGLQSNNTKTDLIEYFRNIANLNRTINASDTPSPLKIGERGLNKNKIRTALLIEKAARALGV